MAISLGDMLIILAEWISWIAGYLINITVGALVILLLLRWLNDALWSNPFGRMYYYVRNQTTDLSFSVPISQFYFPLNQALRFDPTYLLVLIAVAIVWYVTLSVIGYLTTVLGGLGVGLNSLAAGNVASGVKKLIGVSLVAGIFFLITFMGLAFLNLISWASTRTAYCS